MDIENPNSFWKVLDQNMVVCGLAKEVFSYDDKHKIIRARYSNNRYDVAFRFDMEDTRVVIWNRRLGELKALQDFKSATELHDARKWVINQLLDL